MLSGVSKSINRVRNFAASIGQSLPDGLEPSEVAYNIAVGSALMIQPTRYKLDVVAKEFHKSLWGNGLEAYNLIRRTGLPSDLTAYASGRRRRILPFLVYPAVFVNLNNSTAQKTDNSQKVFWDNGPDF